MTRQHVGWVVGWIVGSVTGTLLARVIELPKHDWSYMGPEHINWPLSIATLGVGIALLVIGVRKRS